MIGSIYTDAAREAWTTVPGREKFLEYDANNNPVKIICVDNGNVVYVQYLTYDGNNNCTHIECKYS